MPVTEHPSDLNAFLPSLDEFCRKYLLIGPQPVTAVEAALAPKRFDQLKADLFEHLLLFEKVTIKVYGENIPLVLLLRLFGQRELERLLEQGCIEFLLWTPVVVHMVTDVPGVDAIAAGAANDPVHSDPEQSFEAGLKALQGGLSKREHKILKRKVLPLYRVTPATLSHEATAVTKSAFQSGKLKPLGFDPDVKSISNLQLADRALLGKCATQLLEYRYLLSSGLTAKSDFEYFDLFSDSLHKIQTSGQLAAGYGELAKMEAMPDLRALFPTLEGGLGQVARLREKRSSRKFRAWFAKATHGDEAITKEYLEAISEAKGPLDTRAGKFLKSVGLVAAGGFVGHMVEHSVPAAALGGLAAAAAHPAVDFTFDLLDEFLLDGLRKGWTPRLFLDDVSKMNRMPDQKRS